MRKAKITAWDREAYIFYDNYGILYNDSIDIPTRDG